MTKKKERLKAGDKVRLKPGRYAVIETTMADGTVEEWMVRSEEAASFLWDQRRAGCNPRLKGVENVES